MKKYFFIVLIILLPFLFVLNSCNLMWDKDTTDSLSLISTKPVITVLGDPIISLEQGKPYTDAGTEVSAGNNEFTEEIESGEVDPNTLGYYVVTYKAVNQYDWTSYAYRAVLVHDGTPYGDDISGVYKVGNYDPYTQGFEFETEIIEYNSEIKGYWQIENVWIQKGINITIVFADKSDGTYGVVPVEDGTKGRIFGTAETFIENDDEFIEFHLEVHSKSGEIFYKDFKWEKL